MLVVSTVLSFRHVDHSSEMDQSELCRWTVRNLVSTIRGETGFLKSFLRRLFKILMKVEYLIRSRNVRVVRGVAAEILSMCSRQIEQELLGVVSFFILGEPSILLKKFRHGVPPFSDISFSKRPE